MSVKERHTTNLWLVFLRDACRAAGQPATAGQVANVAGMSRSTAVKRLKKLVNERLAVIHEGVHVNGQKKTGYEVKAAYKW